MSENKKLLVVIDPGHTGNTYNAGAVKGYYESKAVYDLSLYEKTALEKRGIDVILTRERNQDPGLYERGQMAVKKGNGYANVLFESNGADWYGVIRGAVSGAASQEQAKNGPVRYDYIVEHGFHDNPKECLFLSKQENLKAIAEAKAAAIAEYFGIGNKKQSTNQSGQSSQNDRNNNSHQTNQNTSTDSTTLNKKTAYLVRVSVDDLNIRQAPTIYSKAVGFTGKGVFTITEEATGIVNAAGEKSQWGKLKSGQGWICLDYAGKVA